MTLQPAPITIVIALLSTTCAHAANPVICINLSIAQKGITDNHGTWTPLSRDQYLFMKGIYAMDPETPPGLPVGDSAALVKVPQNKDSGLVWFIDGDRACTPVMAPKTLLRELEDIKSGKITHEGDGT
jgi:hypothetical protein